MKETQADFKRWAKELDYRWETRTVVRFKRNERPQTDEQKIQFNLGSYQEQFTGKKLCANPECRYPLADDEGFYVADVGSCCWLCHDMDSALRQTRQAAVHYGTIFEWFDAAHKQWKREQEQKGGVA
jgi:hypothetical protein